MRSGFCPVVVIWKLARSSDVCTAGGVFFFLAMCFNGLEVILVSRLGECERSLHVVAGPSVRARVAGAELRTVTSWDVVGAGQSLHTAVVVMQPLALPIMSESRDVE